MRLLLEGGQYKGQPIHDEIRYIKDVNWKKVLTNTYVVMLHSFFNGPFGGSTIAAIKTKYV